MEQKIGLKLSKCRVNELLKKEDRSFLQYRSWPGDDSLPAQPGLWLHDLLPRRTIERRAQFFVPVLAA